MRAKLVTSILSFVAEIGVSLFVLNSQYLSNNMSSAPQLSLEHIEYLLLHLPTYEMPASPALESLLESLRFQQNALSAPALPLSGGSKNSRGDKRVSTIMDYSKGKNRASAPAETDQETPRKTKKSKTAASTPNKKKAIGKGVSSVDWITIACPSLTPEVTELIASLSRISASHSKAQLDTFINFFKSPHSSMSTDFHYGSISALLHRCNSTVTQSAVHDVSHMISLIQVALYIDRWVQFLYMCHVIISHVGFSVKTIMSMTDITEQSGGFTCKQVSDWYQQGTRLVFLMGSCGCFILFFGLAEFY